ncbi:GAF domain-containing sensor histidine kinase [Geminicoccus roseus]|uniref:GAF domain-containing sensor histidine kinase n=1 Tax=Geminicoccus roseus TaxID=404900 RepID=UPI00041798CE|nr:GAF domain-containing sensor histidine kinase [Geminicoccus roseus]
MNSAIAADIAKIGRLSAVPSILEIVSAMTGLRFAAVARVTDDSWTACAVLDKVGFGLKVGGELEVTTTLCHEIRSARTPIVIEQVSDDSLYCGHHTPRIYGFESYISVPIIRRNGEMFGTICALDPLPARLRDGKILEMVQLYAELIAAQLEIEEQLAASQTALQSEVETGNLREQFIAVLGHDLRNPLFSIMSGLRLLQRQPDRPDLPVILRQMEQSCLRMSGLIDDVLDFARGRLGGGIPVEPRRVDDLAAELARIIAELRSSHPERDIQVQIDLADSVHCDPRRIGQLFSNLLANALTHGDPALPVTVTAQGGTGGFTLSVANPRPLIEPERMAQLFQPYSRGSADAAQAGLGLGLYIAAEIARAHGGAISASSTPAGGTVFTLTLPPVCS